MIFFSRAANFASRQKSIKAFLSMVLRFFVCNILKHFSQIKAHFTIGT